jgi:hypothetical protein
MSGDPPRRRHPSEYRPDLRPMLILGAVIVAVVLGWVLLGPLILPREEASATGLDGRWTLTPERPRATTLVLGGTTYSVDGDLPYSGSGSVASAGERLVFAGDPSCGDSIGTYAVELGEVDRFGLLPEHRAQTMTLTLVQDACARRAQALASGTWTLRASGRDGVHGICDPPNEEAAITGHWPEPSGCADEA